MKSKIFVVTAYRWGDREAHSYVVGAYDNSDLAKEAADNECKYRGGKYECEVIEFIINNGIPRKVYETCDFQQKILDKIKSDYNY